MVRKTDSYFAPAERSTEKDLKVEVNIIEKSNVMSGLLETVSGVLAILNEKRQIISVNTSFLSLLGIENPEECLGLRPGEALECIYADEEPSGCGTTKFCSSCGAAIAMVSSMEQNIPVEKTCALTTKRGEKKVDIYLLVKSHPIEINKKKFILLFLQDITKEEQRAALERTFFHDVNNMLTMIINASQLLLNENTGDMAEIVYNASLRLHKEIAIQKCLTEGETYSYKPRWKKTKIKNTLWELETFFLNHPAASNKNINIDKTHSNISIVTDTSLLLRVISNMVINALEATEKDGTIKVWVENKDKLVSFCVWNRQKIAEKMINRIFQRNFSTKNQPGRGVGTYSMKLFGEEILGGEVTFTTSEKEGTTFRFTHPKK